MSLSGKPSQNMINQPRQLSLSSLWSR